MSLAKHFLTASLLLSGSALAAGCSVIVDGNISPPGFSCEGRSTGQSCGGVPEEEELDWVCIEGTCEPSTCGDTFVDPRSEECDPEIAEPGCQGCLWICTENADCDDGEPCNGAETCNIGTHLCVVGSIPGEGTACTTSDDEPGTCESLVCVPSS